MRVPISGIESNMDAEDFTRSNRISIRGTPSIATKEDLESLVERYGSAQKIESGNGDGSWQVTYETPESATQAVQELNGFDFMGQTLEVNYATNRNNRRGNQRGNFSGNRATEFPLRMLVPKLMVGAIIGKGGATIKQITSDSKARVDVHRKENVPGSMEKAVTIYGQPESCTKACKEILRVMQEESQKTNQGEVCLKVLAHNNLMGRLIGRQGTNIKAIMEQTGTKASVSSVHEITPHNPDRVITIKGSIDGMADAESKISAKLKASYENDMEKMNPMGFGGMMQGMQPFGMMYNPYGMQRYPHQEAGPEPGLYGHHQPHPYGQQMAPPPVETCYLYVPSTAVGALIGTGGSHIRYVQQASGASIKVQERPQEDMVADKDEIPNATERKVTITGTPDAQCKAQWFLFDKIRSEAFFGSDHPRLRVEIMVPKEMVGRIIGKGGKNVRELQRASGAIVKLPETDETAQDQGGVVPVQILGTFDSDFLAQRRIYSLLQRGDQNPGEQQYPRRRPGPMGRQQNGN